MSTIQPMAPDASSANDRMTPQQAAQLGLDKAQVLQTKADVKTDAAKQALDIKLDLKTMLAADAAALKQAQDNETRAENKLNTDEAAFNARTGTEAGVAARVQKQVAATPAQPAVDVMT